MCVFKSLNLTTYFIVVYIVVKEINNRLIFIV